MSLRSDIAEAKKKQTAAPMGRVSVKETVLPGVLLFKINKQQCGLSWSYFMEANYHPAEPHTENADTGNREQNVERIELRYLHKTVTLYGRNLAALMRPIIEMRLDSVPEVPERFLEMEPEEEDGEPVVIRIEAQPLEK